MIDSIYQLSFQDLQGHSHQFADLKGKVLLLVNTASECGLAPQFADLEHLHQKYSAAGLMVIGFPSDNFANQEPLKNSEIAAVCQKNFGVNFLLSEKINVKGPNIHPLFQFLINKKSGFLGSKAIKWNFTKFLIDRNGEEIQRFSPTTQPLSLEKTIVDLLEQK